MQSVLGVLAESIGGQCKHAGMQLTKRKPPSQRLTEETHCHYGFGSGTHGQNFATNEPKVYHAILKRSQKNGFHCHLQIFCKDNIACEAMRPGDMA